MQRKNYHYMQPSGLCPVQYTTKPPVDDVLNHTRNANTWYLDKDNTNTKN